MTIVQPTTSSFQKATQTLQAGGIVAFATETVYGLGCDTFNRNAIELVYQTKGRPAHNPMIAHILDVSWVTTLTGGWDDDCEKLAKSFWPGPFTIVLPKDENVPKEACGGRDTIAIRCPQHQVAQQLLECFGQPISAPSANKSGYISPTTAAHVDEEYHHDILILDGGPCEKGIESTVISLVDKPVILRLGSVTQSEIEDCIGSVIYKRELSQSDSPGTSLRHYSPHATANLMQTDDINKIDDGNCVALVLQGEPQCVQQCIQMPQNPNEYGVKLYSALREADRHGVSCIAIEQPPNTTKWDAIQDRLLRCSSTQTES